MKKMFLYGVCAFCGGCLSCVAREFNLVIILLSVLCFALATWALVLISDLKEEKEKRWDEISRGVDLENIVADRTRDVIHYSDMCDEQRQYILHLQTRNIDLQDKYSALICPTNNHVWQDGVCKKCGREYNG